MQDKERETLKANAEELANLLTENIPFLIKYYVDNGVINEAEREDIIQAESAHDIKKNLVWTLAAKEGISLEAVIEGLNATENQCVAKEITQLLSPSKSDVDGAGDRPDDVGTYATSLVDEVIATAEQRMSLSEPEVEDTQKSMNANEGNEENEFDSQPISNNVVETEVQVHETENEFTQEVVGEEDVPDKSVAFQETVDTIIEPEKSYDTNEDISLESSRSGDFAELQNNDSEPEDLDNIDIEKEFDMQTEPERSLNNNSVTSFEEKSSDIIIENGGESHKDDNDNDNELAAALARKALVRQQVEMFEKNCPGGGKVKYTLRTAGDEKGDKDQTDTGGSNVKNLKNFFQRLSTSDNATSPQPAPAKSVGKLKVTFPAS